MKTKKIISATGRKGKAAAKIIVLESYNGAKTLSEIFMTAIISELSKKDVG